MDTSMFKPTFHVDQLISSSEASKKFGEVRKKAKSVPQYITENGNVDTVILSYELFESMFHRLNQLEQQELQREVALNYDPEATESDKDMNAAMRQAQASLAIEGLVLPEEGQKLVQKRLGGEISQADFLKAALEIATRE
ncbi:type II toxin-antitoxin system Phd/YefM family antitoxin [Paenibacillus sp. MZ04-78.2]|uniref:type II toxin-antitoxin system Phd/YefM family antitoxin n=1 Tax=Paenibacillus sp. MZ04-78.2 TaxID=2962034 RepID=UPI0020B801F6|nr:type II toxin-antitoxin system Phd/YefM family antitoxin [Paenibacillus sp. MZ04-78.2]MCP3776105.1 type II toxin-antitoxin system Phd/YefM family antitoxin [Paenibacillus sp. MZ04-78.2]